MKKLTLSKLNLFIAAAGVLLIVGLVIDGTVTKPQLKELMTFEDDKTRLQGAIEQQRLFESDTRTVAGLLGVESLDELGRTSAGDPIAYISRLLDESKLVRLGLTTSGREDVGSLTMSSYTLRTMGDFREIQHFVQSLESGLRLATIDAFKIMPTMDGDNLEGRFNLSIYDVKEEL
jgi:hypothetical protein